MRKPRVAPGHGVRGAELGMGQREQHHRGASQQPRDDRCRAGKRGSVKGAEQPARADDRPQRRKHEPDEADLPSELGRGALGSCNERLSQLGRWSTSIWDRWVPDSSRAAILSDLDPGSNCGTSRDRTSCLWARFRSGLTGQASVLSADVGRAPLLGLPVQRATFRRAPPDVPSRCPLSGNRRSRP